MVNAWCAVRRPCADLAGALRAAVPVLQGERFSLILPLGTRVLEAFVWMAVDGLGPGKIRVVTDRGAWVVPPPDLSRPLHLSHICCDVGSGILLGGAIRSYDRIDAFSFCFLPATDAVEQHMVLGAALSVPHPS